MMTNHRISTIHNKGNKMGKNMRECNRRKPNHDSDNVGVKHRTPEAKLGIVSNVVK
jgi:hypothetical protein